MEVTGIIKAIDTENNNGNDKKVISLSIGKNNLLFIEFQGRARRFIDRYSEGDRVSISLRFNGKISKLGRRYNNLVGRKIEKI